MTETFVFLFFRALLVKNVRDIAHSMERVTTLIIPRMAQPVLLGKEDCPQIMTTVSQTIELSTDQKFRISKSFIVLKFGKRSK